MVIIIYTFASVKGKVTQANGLLLRITVVWDMTTCSSVDMDQHFGANC
jgi:hypothetical protein